MSPTPRLVPLALALTLGVSGLDVAVVAPAALAEAANTVALSIRRQQGRVDLVVTGLGVTARVVSQRQAGSTWTARLKGKKDSSVAVRSQQVSMQDAGFESITLEPSGSELLLTAKASEGISLPAPVIASNGQELLISFRGLAGPTTTRSTARLDLSRPGRVQRQAYVPPMRRRAVAPPLGDMAVGTMLINNRSFVQASGPPVSLTLNNAPAKDALMSMARLGGYGFVFVGDGLDADAGSGESGGYPVTMAFRNERFDRALNSVLMASGLQGRLDGRTLLVGDAVAAKSFGPQMSKVFRLNQVSVASAGDYLASLGASMTAIKTVKITTGEAATAGGSQPSNEASTTETSIRETETYGSLSGPLVGLSGVTDDRLGTVTLVGDPSLISVAQSYLRQLDLRKRQVAVKVQILTVQLNNDKSIDSSFSARMGDTFLVSRSGQAHMNFGQYKPGNPSGTGVFQEGEYGTPGTYRATVPGVEKARMVDPMVPAQTVVPPMVDQQVVIPPVEPGGAPTLVPVYDATGQPIKVPSSDPTAQPTLVPTLGPSGQPVLVPSTDPTAAQTPVPVFDRNGQPVYVPGKDPAQFRHPDDSFFAYIESLVVSSTTKVLAQPTLLVQEGETASVKTGQSVITGVSSTETANGSTQYTNTREDAGLNLKVTANKIDDNGFVTLKLNPKIGVPISAGIQQGVQIFNIEQRELTSGDIRLRDGQSLILTGVITDSDRQLVRKWPILGDMPLIGQLFRQSASTREKTELVVIVTPTVLDDRQGGRYGYAYRSGTAAGRQLLQSKR